MTTPAEVLIVHQRASASSCLCGWSELGASFVEHQLRALADAGYVVVQRHELDRARWTATARAEFAARHADMPCTCDRLPADVRLEGVTCAPCVAREIRGPVPEGPRGGAGPKTSEKRACEVVYCPTAGEDECLTHGGFDVCCDRPDLHETSRRGRTCAMADSNEGETQP